MWRPLGGLTICALLGLGALPAPVAEPPLPVAPVPAYWRDLAATLERSGEARALLGAALIEAWPDDGAPPDPDRLADLFARAQKAAPGDPLVWWGAALVCRPAGAQCEEAQAAARTHLLRVDPQNALGWLLGLGPALRDGAAAAARQALAQAAAAGRADDYLVEVALLLAAQIEAHPPPAVVLRASAEPNAERFAHAAAFAIAATVMPPWQPLFEACAPTHAAPSTAAVGDCRAIARLLQHGDSLAALGIGLALERRLTGGRADLASLDRRRRALHWMGAQMAAFEAASPNAPSAYLAALRRTRSEPRTLAELMQASGIPLEPPGAWRDPQGD